jgi:23S rRNA pseudouridine1911/1915/1917 synthase
MEKRVKHSVDVSCNDWTVGQVLQKKLKLTKHQIKSAKYRLEGICVNGQQARTTARVAAGDVVEVLLEENRSDAGKVIAVPGPVDIIYEDEDLLLLNKPAGMPVHPSHGHYRDTLANYLQYYLAQQGNYIPVRAVGRLDKETSGLVVFGKNQVTAARLGSQQMFKNSVRKPINLEHSSLRKGSIEKEYLALVHGHLNEKEGCIDLPIARAADELNKMEVSPQGKPARTHYRVMEEYPASSLVSLRLDTGRTHQIRIHMSYIGHPLLGDQIYGRETHAELARAALHCYRVTIIHPYTEAYLRFEAPLPVDMQTIVSGYSSGHSWNLS